MNPSTTQARVVVDELIRGGVRDVVLCPGSRNAPLAFALQDADRAGRIRLHVRIDERTAGYLAIGLAIGAPDGPAPVCVAMTSGTAVANLGPAVVEANYARVPLIVLSANRPYELLGTGANQTMEQLGYFGSQVRATISLGLAEDAPDKLAGFNATWRSATCRVLVAATGSRTANAGPVHFDIPLREPLVPDPEPLGAAVPPGRPDGRPWTYTPPVTFDQPLEIDLSPDTVVIAGHGAGVHPNLAELPTVAEPTAPAYSNNPLHPLALSRLRPQQVIMLGRPTLHRPVSALLADPKVPVYALTTGPRWPDVSGNSQATGTRAVTTGSPNPAWLRRCAEVNRQALAAVHEQLAAHPLTTGLHVAAAVATALRPGDQLVLGASNPVRDAALVGLDARGIKVGSNRGVAGIDGTVSTAIGAALAHERVGKGVARTIALIGDLTFVHDSSGLLIGPTEPTPRNLTIVVSNDNGGGIFELLEQGDPRFSDVSARIFGTPHDVDVGALCRAYHVESRQLEVDDLQAALDEPAAGLRVLEVKADRSSLRQLHAAIKAAL
ncbi:2-succinyl-5-enolpyruvyl-6-hydroxy-3-cyclohexene-1-carboxylic-acid synthase [Mycobacterium intermedium]|uniref:2-succinyl-5-enolpyruvyl-6-hydroxy-3-cyclohexene-1-carboxylate synthase n=1 Tax=Mycobacterium intermedium TaxID=28445 RepID=A0A1E3S8Z0_MYCIE|nr:2-succinyl-5-enolpyruvyl-6-hydroxy-3-cyclohexene-1-carboxylic-acid synthase [Mycobacterium intermedium]MCV6966623.1 2-succinyl-5-enolpyruvyl-6-hydroxy-3-cyclohexene-1-carboxylic-acid synthase [Mycobacterium intermedium]ODQ98628.1 2-succinyl-5-enolpyruvyl-6-hydroxy-3-cyclohexene-1-carboxylic-acid synthase [Mycobacterium intermedium]OPE46052.1 2-succinyl-5-enolpyruvyl-6-hydroxy-3-cyclohexene-1-carboxylic-acid synthase [Mycobacterium intermedium]ORA97012.1 2-succinyl-5-enolpyruvyl-6-hydroxy-3-c